MGGVYQFREGLSAGTELPGTFTNNRLCGFCGALDKKCLLAFEADSVESGGLTGLL